MALIYQFRRLAFAQVLLGIVAFCLAAENPGMLLVAGSIGALAWYVTEGPNGRPLPRWVTNLGAVAAVAWMLLELFGQGGRQQPADMVVAMGQFTMWLQILLLYSRKTNREYAQVLVLSVLQMIAASVLSVSMVYGVILAAYCVLALVTMLLFHFKSTSDKVLEHNQRAAIDPAMASRPKPVVGRGHRWHFRFMTVGVGLMCAAVAMAVFVVSPRSDDAHNPVTARDAGGRTEAGFSQQVSTRSSPGRRGGREPVLNVRFFMHDVNVGGESRPPWLLRGAALDQYNPITQKWSRSRRVELLDHRLSLPPEGVALAELDARTPTLEAHITLRQLGHNVLFTHHQPAFVQSDSVGAVTFNPLDQQLTSDDAAGALVYQIAWPVAPQPGMVERYAQRLPELMGTLEQVGWRQGGQVDGLRDNYARGWSVHRERVARYTNEVLAEHGLARDPDARYTDADATIARVLTEHLREQCTYTLTNPDVADHQDPVIQFLFHHQQGHCELFASALAAMARSIGMQARVITGYVASEYNTIGGYYVVRQRNAHAWVEINTGPDRQWRTFDPTPPSDLAEEHRPASGWWMAVWQLYDHAEFAWIRSVVAFDQRSRQAVIDSIQETLHGNGDADDSESWLQQLGQFLRDLPDYWRLDRLSWTIAGLIVVAIGICLAYLARLLVLRRQRLVALQLTALPRAKRRGLARRLRFYLTMLDMLERHGYIRPSWQSPFSFAQELAEANPMRFDPVVSLTELFYEIRFGHRQLDPDRKRRITAHLKQLEHALVHPRG